jgi:hypothetical protein
MQETAHVTEGARVGSAQALARASAMGSSLARPLKVAARAALGAVAEICVGIGQAIDQLGRVRAFVGLRARSSGRMILAVAAAGRTGASRVAGTVAGLRGARARVVARHGLGSGAVALTTVLALYALDRPAPGPAAPPSAVALEEIEEIPVAVSLPDPPAGQPAAPAEVPLRATAAAAMPPGRVPSRSAPDRPRPAPESAEVSGRTPTVPDVIGRLVVKNLSTGERTLATLIEAAGGVQLGRQRDRASTMLDAAVPRSGYAEFSRGLARIGSWRVEAERSRLPDGVRVTIRLSE